MPYIGAVTVVVRDYDEAIRFYVDAVGFVLVEDTPLPGGNRWVRVRPPGAVETSILLAVAADESQAERVGAQTGGRVGFFLNTDDFWRDHARMVAAGVQFAETPREEPYGTVAVFQDLYGNQWDLIQNRDQVPGARDSVST